MSARISPEEQFARMLELSSPLAVSPDASIAPMANLAVALRAAGQSAALPSPDPAFRDALRQRLVAVATVQNDLPVIDRARSRGAVAVSYRMRRRVAALAGAVTVATSFAGVGVAAARSLPGDPFYGVKRATEAVQLWTARGDEAKGKRHLEFAATRLAEARKLPANSSHVTSTLAAMDADTTAGSAELISAYQSSHSTAPLADLVTFTNTQVAGLTKLAATLPPAVRARETTSLTLLGGVAVQVKKVAGGVCILCPPNGVAPAPSDSPLPSSRQSTPGSRASAHPSTHPSSVYPSTHPSGHPSTHPTQSAGSSKPTHPSHLIPTSVLSSILHPKTKHTPIPILTKLLGTLGLGG